MADAQAAQLAFMAALGRIGCSPPLQQEIIAYTGCMNIAMLGLLAPDDISKMCTAFRTRTINPIQVTVIQEQLLLAVRFWVSNRQRLQKPVEAQVVTAALAYNQAQSMRHMLEDEARADKELTAKMPDKLKAPNGWRIFAEAMETYLMHLRGSGRIPLKYVIWKNTIPLPNAVYDTEMEENIAICPLTGDDFQRDNARVYGIIKQLVLEGPGRSYILPYDNTSNGRAAWLSLTAHFEGESYRNRNVEEAYATLEALHYEGERRGFTFEKFVEKHNESYLELERYDEPVLESKKVRDFIRRINSPELTAAVQQVKANPTLLTNFQQAVNFIALSVTPVKQLQRGIGALNYTPQSSLAGQYVPNPLHEGTLISLDTQSTASSSITNPSRYGFSHGGRGRGTFQGRAMHSGGRANRGGRAGRIPPIHAGRAAIPTPGYLTPQQWSTLTPEQRDRILIQRGTKRNASAITSNYDEQPEAYNAVGTYQDEYVQLPPDDHLNLQYQYQENVPTTENDVINQYLDDLGGTAGNEFGQRSRLSTQEDDSRYIGMFKSSIRSSCQTAVTRNICHIESSDESSGPIELDSHADTCTAGKNARVISYSNQVCQVSPYHPRYSAMQDVPIAQVGVAYTHPETGVTYILVINQALYMKDLPHTLINPNQLRCNGIIVDDCPKHLAPEPEKATHSIFIPEHKLRLPLAMKGVISYLPTRYPSLREIETCQWIELTQDKEWNPHSPSFADNERLIDQAIYVEKPRLIAEVTTDISANPLELNPVCEIQIAATESHAKRYMISPQSLAAKWNIGLETAKCTIEATTQLAIRQAIHPIQRRYRTEIMQLRYPRLGGRHGRFYTDTFFAKTPSLRGCQMAQIYVNDINFTKVFPIKHKSEAPNTLVQFMQEVGIPSMLHTDDAKELVHGKMAEITKKAWIHTTQSEPYSPWQVRAELANRELKKAVRYRLHKTNAPKRLWDFCSIYQAEIRNLTAHPLFALQGRTPHEMVTGNTPDISEYTDYEWYQTVWYLDQEASFPEDKRKLAKWLGVAHRVGQALCYYLLPSNGKPIVRSTVQPLSHEELQTDVIQHAISTLERQIMDAIPDINPTVEVPQDVLNNEILQDVYEPLENEAEQPEIAEFTPEAYDAMISAEVLLPFEDVLVPAIVTGRKRDQDGNPIGTANNNPIVDTRIYEVTFPDGHVEEYTANIIAENLYTQLDSEGRRHQLLEEIIDHHKDKTATPLDKKWIHHGSNKTLNKNTQGWKLKVRWKDQSTSWEPLRNLKTSNPIEVAEYAVTNQISDEVAFAWWVPHAIKCHKHMKRSLAAMTTIRRNEKYGIEIPTTIKRALEIDKETNTNFWEQAIAKEMLHVTPAFEILDQDKKAPIGSKWIPCHMVFDVKIDFTRKARFVAGGHKTEPPTSITYSSVVARDSVRIAFLLSALNGLDILSADVGNAYLNAYTKEKVHTTCGLEFGQQFLGRTAIIRKALYGLKSSGAAWRSLFASTLHDMGFRASHADPDVWIAKDYKRKGTTITSEGTPSRGEAYYKYVFVYVDDILVLAEYPKDIITTIAKAYRLKEGSIMEPKTYLGALIRKHQLPENPSKPIWTMSADKYIKEAVRNVEVNLAKQQKRLPSDKSTPLASNYRPELDISAPLSPEEHRTYQQLIGVLRWAVELGRIDIHLPVALMAQHLAAPRKGHLNQVHHIFAYLKGHMRSRIILDDTKPLVDENRFPKVDWREFYPDAKEAIPPNAPTPLGNPVTISCFVDADHAGNVVTRRSHTGIVIFCNRAPIIWFSKRQNTVETSSFGSEFIALRIAVELIEGLRYKLRMFGIPIDGATNVFCDNNSVVTNAQIPESTLRRKHNSIAYHRVREAVAAGTIRVAKESKVTNIADMLTKPVSGPRLRYLCARILF